MDEEKVRQVLEKVIRPVLNEHDGDAELVEVTEEGVARVRLLGACASCPSAQMTMTTVVETTLKEICPDIKAVEPVYDEVSDEDIQEVLAMFRSKKF